MTRPDEDTERHREMSVSSDGQEAPDGGFGASEPVAEIIPLQRPKTYLEACREQGVHQEYEELLDETAQLRGKVTQMRARSGEDLPKASVALLGDHSPAAAAFADSLNEQRDRMQARLRSMVEVVGASPLAGSWFPTFALMLLDEEEVWTPETAAGYLAACLVQDARNKAPAIPEPDEERTRLNGEGLRGGIYRKDPQ